MAMSQAAITRRRRVVQEIHERNKVLAIFVEAFEAHYGEAAVDQVTNLLRCYSKGWALKHVLQYSDEQWRGLLVPEPAWERIKAALVQKQIQADLLPAELRDHSSLAHSSVGQ